jgi:hypothetical protein
MSKLQEILEDIAEYISQSYHNIRVYYDDSMMNPNISLPAISFQTGEMKPDKQGGCDEYIKELEIRLHTSTLDKSALLQELWDFEEQIIQLIRKGNREDTLTRHSIELQYISTLPIGALVYNPPDSDKEVFFSNLLRVVFQLKYEL